MTVVEGADGFKWEQNIGTSEKPLAGGAIQEWWRIVEGSTDDWWRITREEGPLPYFLRKWKKGANDDRPRLIDSEYAPTDTLPRAQEFARLKEVPDDDSRASIVEGNNPWMPRR